MVQDSTILQTKYYHVHNLCSRDESHNDTEHPIKVNKSKLYKCDNCSRSLKSMGGLKLHLEVCMNKNTSQVHSDVTTLQNLTPDTLTPHQKVTSRNPIKT